MIRKTVWLSIVILSLACNSFADTPEKIAQAWKERGIVALSRIENFSAKEDMKSKYEYLLEYAFAMHAVADKSDEFAFVHKIENDLDFYKVILKKGKNPKFVRGGDESGLFVINYIYDHKTGELIGTKVELLPKGWYLHLNPAMPNVLFLNVAENIFIAFDLLNPINSFVEKM